MSKFSLASPVLVPTSVDINGLEVVVSEQDACFGYGFATDDAAKITKLLNNFAKSKDEPNWHLTGNHQSQATFQELIKTATFKVLLDENVPIGYILTEYAPHNFLRIINNEPF